MTNRLRQHRTDAGLTVSALARMIAVDPAVLSLIERDETLIRLDVLMSAAGVLNVPMSALFPDVSEVLDAAENSEEDPYETVFEKGAIESLLIAGIDPDPSMWVAIFEFAGGAQRRYHVNCSEKESIREQLLEKEDQQVITFSSEARIIAVSRAAAARCLITDQSAFASWDSREQGFEIIVVRTDDDRPQRYLVTLDQDGSGSDQLMSLVKRVQQGGSPGRFCVFTDADHTEVLLPLSAVAAIEVPLGLLDPGVYNTSDPVLEDMSVQGSA